MSRQAAMDPRPIAFGGHSQFAGAVRPQLANPISEVRGTEVTQ